MDTALSEQRFHYHHHNRRAVTAAMDGLITKAIGGLYHVESPDGILEDCKARGIFRKRNISPCVGDRVRVEDGCIVEIYPRRNEILRPPLANLDHMVFVVSACEPAPNLTLLDEFLAVCEYKNIAPLLVFTKIDLADADSYAGVYRAAGYPVCMADYRRADALDELSEALKGSFSAFTGNSGVGKSTLLNALDENLNLQTAQISKKLGRGRHTTRETALYTLPNGAKIADTPGFSTFELESYAKIPAAELAGCFPEFRPLLGKCRYADCLHDREPGCAVTGAVREGAIAKSRLESYQSMLTLIRARKEWE